MSEKTESKTDWRFRIAISIPIAILGVVGIYLYLVYVDSHERYNLIKKTVSIGEEGYLSIDDYVLNKHSAKFFTIKVTAVDVQNNNNNDNDKIVILYATFKNIRYNIVDINHYDYYLITDEEHSYQSTALLTVDGTKVLKDTHKECVMKFNIPTDEKPVKLIIMKEDRIAKEIILRHS